MILVLASMQLDGVIRLYGMMMVLLGDNGLINGALLRWHVIQAPLPLMYNVFGVIVGDIQITLPFMVLSLIGVIRSIHPSLEEAARGLGASPGQTFRHIILPLSMPGVLAGMLLVFALARPTCRNMEPTARMAAKGITNTVDSTKGYWIPDYQKYLDHSDEIEETVNGIFAE
jgi:ABC-type spermidine/putrescine transport system permease subunit I